MTTADNITAAQLAALKVEAGNAGDHMTRAACILAEDGDRSALELCAEVIADAEAQWVN